MGYLPAQCPADGRAQFLCQDLDLRFMQQGPMVARNLHTATPPVAMGHESFRLSADPSFGIGVGA